MREDKQIEEDKFRWIETIKAGDSKALELLYRAYRREFISWMYNKTGCDRETALDVFQESVLALYKNAKAGYIDDIGSSIKTYLFAIGKKRYWAQSKENKLQVVSLEEEDESILEKLMVVPQIFKPATDRQKMISTLLSRLRPMCQDILVLFYYKNMSMKLLAEQQNYRSVNVAKVMKNRCMESLRKLVLGSEKKRSTE